MNHFSEKVTRMKTERPEGTIGGRNSEKNARRRRRRRRETHHGQGKAMKNQVSKREKLKLKAI